jgi:hypothetical protein
LEHAYDLCYINRENSAIWTGADRKICLIARASEDTGNIHVKRLLNGYI